mmetsp:Transcript_18591/g.53256  ORF Transcript_18591/g.53256 Transcript_18591/m.53256 type:complete len:251 (+) Transcript_18591:85-837(+)
MSRVAQLQGPYHPLVAALGASPTAQAHRARASGGCKDPRQTPQATICPGSVLPEGFRRDGVCAFGESAGEIAQLDGDAGGLRPLASDKKAVVALSPLFQARRTPRSFVGPFLLHKPVQNFPAPAQTKHFPVPWWNSPRIPWSHPLHDTQPRVFTPNSMSFAALPGAQDRNVASCDPRPWQSWHVPSPEHVSQTTGIRRIRSVSCCCASRCASASSSFRLASSRAWAAARISSCSACHWATAAERRSSNSC